MERLRVHMVRYVKYEFSVIKKCSGGGLYIVFSCPLSRQGLARILIGRLLERPSQGQIAWANTGQEQKEKE